MSQYPYSKEQQAFIDFKEKPVVLLAGAGSGKTRSMVGRLHRILTEGISPDQILLLTFTNKAAKNMVERACLLNESAIGVRAGTFHSVFFRLLTEYGLQVGVYKGQKVLNDYQQQRAWEKAYEMVYTDKERGTIDELKMGGLRRLKTWYQKLRTSELRVKRVMELADHYPDIQTWEGFKPGGVEAVYKYYHRLKETYNGYDFDDILVNFKRMMEIPSIQRELQRKYKHILVDEYQDTSWIQAEALKLLAGSNPNIAVVGDPNQSIYSFLSAHYRNIIDFPKTFNGAQLTLQENYRSTDGILTFANKLMSRSREAPYNPLSAMRDANHPKPMIHKYGSDRCEAEGVLRDIQAAILSGTPAHEIAILSRQSATTRLIESLLSQQGLAYVKYGGIKLTQKQHIKQFLAFLELVLNPKNWLAWEILLPMIPHIGDKLTERLLDDLSTISDWTWSEPPPVSLGTGKRWEAFKAFWDIIKRIDTLKTANKSQFMTGAFAIFKELYTIYWNGLTDDEKTNMANEELEEERTEGQMDQRLKEVETYIVNLAEHRNEELAVFLSQYALDDSLDATLTEAKKSDTIVVSTIHSAKGLEWDRVFIVGLEEGTLPPQPRTYSVLPGTETYTFEVIPHTEPIYLEEELRLLYVAMTRAKNRLHICYSAKRFNRGMRDSTFLKPFKPSGALLQGAIQLDTHSYILEKMRNYDE